MISTRPSAPWTVRRCVAVVAIVSAPWSLVACGDDGDDGDVGPVDTISPSSTITTNVPQSSTSVPVPTSDPGAAGGQGSQPEQPGGTAQDPMVTNTTQAPPASAGE